MFSLQDLLSEALKYRLLTLIIVVLCALALHFLFRFCIAPRPGNTGRATKGQ